MIIRRRKTKAIKIGNLYIGSSYPIAIQSMAKYKTSDTAKVIEEINILESCGCEIVRLAIKDEPDASAIKAIKQKTRIPIVADIHFNWRLALEAIYSGVDKIRLNPGNIYKEAQVMAVAQAAKSHRIPIRVGLNSGSLPKITGVKAGKGAAMDRMVQGALNYIKIIEKTGFTDIVVSLKASTIADTVYAYRKFSKLCGYPLHLGLTATGSPASGTIKSSIAIGSLLLDGIGDTIRISLTAQAREEVRVARSILESLGLRHFGPEVISCPTCGRCEVNLVDIVKELEAKLSTLSPGSCRKPVKIAVMGCVVNGPGEAKEADIGVAFGKKEGLLFKKGKPVRKISVSDCVNVLLKELKK